MRRWRAIGAVTAALAVLLYLLLAPAERSTSTRPGERASGRSQPLAGSATDTALASAPALPLSETQSSSAQERDAPDLPGTLSVWGQVTDESGQPLEGVRVHGVPEDRLKLPEIERLTDAQGRFRLPSLPLGPLVVSFERERFVTEVIAHYVSARFPEPLTVQLRVAPTIQGRVVDASGSPLPRVRVELFALDRTSPSINDDGSDSPLQEPIATHESGTLTGADGAFILDTPRPDDWRVSVDLEGFHTVRRDVTSPARDVLLVLGAGASLEVTLVDEQDRPVPKARVDLWGEFRKRTLRVDATTDEAGHAVLRGLEPGHYTLTAIPPEGQGFRLAGTKLRIREQEAQRVRLRFEAGPALSGIVVDQTGQPVADVAVEARLKPHQFPESPFLDLAVTRLQSFRCIGPHITRTGPDGRFTLPHLLPERYRLTFKKLGYVLLPEEHETKPEAEELPNWEAEELPNGVDASPGQAPLRVVLTYYGRVSGRVVGADGEPLSTFELNERPHQSPDGTFTLAAPEPGRHTLYVHVPGVGGLRHEYEANVGQDVDVGDLVVEHGRKVRVRLEEAASSLPIGHGELWVLEDPEGRRLSAAELGGTPIRDGEGYQLLRSVPPRPVSVAASPYGYEPGEVKVGPQEQTVTMRLRPWAIVRGTVLVGGQPLAKGEVNFYTLVGKDVEELRVINGGFSGHVLPPGRYLAQADCDSCEEPEPIFLRQPVTVPQPGESFTLELRDSRSGATVEVPAFPKVERMELVPGQQPLPTTFEQFHVALGRGHPQERLKEEKGLRFRHVPAGLYTLLVLYELDDWNLGFLRQEVEVPPTGLVRLELAPR